MTDFNPRSPHGERPCSHPIPARDTSFQSTLPARGATCALLEVLGIQPISIHAPRTGSDRGSVRGRAPPVFQSTLPARGATERSKDIMDSAFDFNPRSPHGERQFAKLGGWDDINISIHAPRTGSDLPWLACLPRYTYNFNPRSPHGERRQTVRLLSTV